MRMRSLFIWGAGIAATCAALLIGWRYRSWKQYQYQRLRSGSRLLVTSRGTVEYQMEGAGPPVLVLHGSPGGYDQGMAVAHLLDLSDYTVLSLSRPGYRRTPLSCGQTPEAQADLFAATLDTLNMSQVVVIALSGGGPSALQFALRHPHRCRGVLMISALAHEYTEEGVYRSLPPGQRLQKRLFDRLLVWNPLLYLLSGLSKRIPQEEQSVEFIESLVMNSLRNDGYRNDMRQFATLPRYVYQDIALPVLIVHGTADIDVPFRQAQELANTISHAQLLAIEGANHLSILVGEQARAAIRNFLQSLLSGEDIQTSGKQEQIQEEF